MNLKVIFIHFSILLSLPCFGQNQQPEKTPREIASEQAELMKTSLNLNDSQLFYLDSILQSNFEGLNKEFEGLRASGRQNNKTYEEVQAKWRNKTLEAVEKILDKTQLERYMKITGMSSKERKRRLEARGER